MPVVSATGLECGAWAQLKSSSPALARALHQFWSFSGDKSIQVVLINILGSKAAFEVAEVIANLSNATPALPVEVTHRCRQNFFFPTPTSPDYCPSPSTRVGLSYD